MFVAHIYLLKSQVQINQNTEKCKFSSIISAIRVYYSRFHYTALKSLRPVSHSCGAVLNYNSSLKHRVIEVLNNELWTF